MRRRRRQKGVSSQNGTEYSRVEWSVRLWLNVAEQQVSNSNAGQ